MAHLEFLPVAQRGTWGMGVVLFWSGGAMFESLVAMYVMPKLGWRWLVGISSLPLGLLLLLWPVLPESPWCLGSPSLLRNGGAVCKLLCRWMALVSGRE